MRNLPLERMLDAKVVATAITTAVIGWVVALFAKNGIIVGEAEIATAAAILGPLVAGLITFAVGYVKRDPRVKALLDFYRRVTLEGNVEPGEPGEPTERGYALVELAFALCVLLIGVAVLLALT